MAEGEQPRGGFSCPGIFWLPGLCALLAVHAVALLGLAWGVRSRGAPGMEFAVAGGALAIFWLVFAIVARWVGTNGALNLLGLFGALVAPPVSLALLARWIWG